uniref:Resistance to inhibitors of cholinesterase protein 3 N-terminal domain-containing protein n=1 Tax=Astatotilapia calliptera TaxID=8154 RepID=A0A3P8QCZ3_ASTCA
MYRLTPGGYLAGPGACCLVRPPPGCGGPSGLRPLGLRFGSLWHSWLPAEPADTPVQPPIASARWLLGGTDAPPVVLLGLSHSGASGCLGPGSPPCLLHALGAGRGKKYNLMTQVIPLYGFGILLYILYIIHKLTCRGKANKPGKNSAVTVGTRTNTIIANELARLQERLLQPEEMMERIVSRRNNSSGSGRRRRSKTTTSKKEEKLLRQLRQITQPIQESRLEGASPEMEAEEVPYGADWEGYPEETYPEYDEPCLRRGFKTVKLEEPPTQPTAEALAERMEQEEEEVMARKLSIDVFHYPKEDTYEDGQEDKEDQMEDEDTEVEEEEEADEDDPVMEAESLQFSCDGSSNPEEEAEEDIEGNILMSANVEGEGRISADTPKEVGVSGLRMRNRRET